MSLLNYQSHFNGLLICILLLIILVAVSIMLKFANLVDVESIVTFDNSVKY